MPLIASYAAVACGTQVDETERWRGAMMMMMMLPMMIVPFSIGLFWVPLRQLWAASLWSVA